MNQLGTEGTGVGIAYTKPVLTRLGSVAEMTCGNSGSGGDGNGRKPPGQG